MKTELYRIFVTVAECGSITGAARELHIAQPALSSQIRSIEQAYQVEMFTRLPRSVQLTDAGNIFYQYCKQVLLMEDNVCIELENCRRGDGGVLKFGTTRSNPDPLVRALLDRFSDLHPKVHYEIFELSSAELISKIDNGLIEIAAVRFPHALPPFVEEIASVQENILAICSESSGLLPLDTDEIDITLLSGKPISIGSGLYKYISEQFQSYNVTPVVHSLNASRQITLQWAEVGQAIALLPMPEGFISAPKETRVYHIRDNPLTTKRQFITKKGHKLSPAAEHFAGVIRSVIHPST